MLTKKQRSAAMKAAWVRRKAKQAALREAIIEADGKEDAVRFFGPSLPQLLEGHRPDMVNHPPHYTATKYQPADVADEWFPHEPLLWNSNKYLARWDKKGDPIENLEKAVWYIKRKIAQLKGGK